MELTQIELIKAAKRLGIQVDLLEECATENILLSHNGLEVLFCAEGVPLHQSNNQAFQIADNKQLSKLFFRRMGLPHPLSMVFRDLEESKDEIQAFMLPNQLYVCKPLDGTEGKGVCMNLGSIRQVKAAWDDWKSQYDAFMLEEQKEGGDLRLQAIGGKLVAACIRKPAFVKGNGKQTLQELITARQAVVQAQNPANKLDMDEASYELLEKQHLMLDSIPDPGQKVQLKYVANMNQGAVATDITDEIHPAYYDWVAHIARGLNLPIFALDVLAKDYTQAPSSDIAWALEINARPYWYHHTFSERRQHDVAAMILREVFSVSGKGHWQGGK